MEFYTETQKKKMQFTRDALKKIKVSGQLELSKSEKAVKTSFKQIDALKEEDLEDIFKIIKDRENAKQGQSK